MPDWFYRTVGQPLLFALPDSFARKLALGTIGMLGRSRVGCGVIDFLGHMSPDSRLAFEKRGIRFSSPLGMGWRVDPEARATEGLARFGVGCIEVLDKGDRSCRRGRSGTLEDAPLRSPPRRGAVETGASLQLRRLSREGKDWIRLPNGEELEVVGRDRSGPFDRECPGTAFQLGEALPSGGFRVGARLEEGDLERVRNLRNCLPPAALMVVSGGVGAPAEALALREAGADLILVEAGLVFSGPGLAKRCNEALASRAED